MGRDIRLGQNLAVRQTQTIAMTPQMQESISLLQKSTVEMRQEIQRKLEENPLLELDDPEWENTESSQEDDEENSGGEDSSEDEDVEEKKSQDIDFADIVYSNYVKCSRCARIGETRQQMYRFFTQCIVKACI